MTSRRYVLKSALAGVAGSMIGGSRFAIGAPGEGVRQSELTRVVFDERFSDSLSFAGAFENLGVATTPIRGDIGQLWYKDLRQDLGKRKMPVAGMTDRVALFCLEELARDVGMRVSVRIDHLVDMDGSVLHQYADNTPLFGAAEGLGQRTGFGRKSARLVDRLVPQHEVSMLAQKQSGPDSPLGITALVSWVIS